MHFAPGRGQAFRPAAGPGALRTQLPPGGLRGAGRRDAAGMAAGGGLLCP